MFRDNPFLIIAGKLGTTLKTPGTMAKLRAALTQSTLNSRSDNDKEPDSVAVSQSEDPR